jgi:hypothetical protein
VTHPDEERAGRPGPLARWGTFAGIALVALVPRAIYPVSRAWLWTMRAVNFGDVLLAGAWADTYQQYHPGVTVMWLSGFALKVLAWMRGLSSAQLLDIAPAPPGTADAVVQAGVLPLALVIALCIAGSAALVARLADRRVGLAAGLLMALDPFFISYSKEIHLNGLLTMFMLVSALLLLVYLKEGKRAPLVWSGVFAGLAVLTKSPAIFLLPYAALALSVYPLLHGVPLREALRGLWRPALKLVAWLAAAVAVFVLLWPAMWVQPVATLRAMGEGLFFHVETPNENDVYFMGEVVDDPGAPFYLATMGWRMTAITLPMALAALAYALLNLRKPGRHDLTWLLAAYVLFFTAQMSLSRMKQMSYILPAFPPLDILAAIGVVGTVDRLARLPLGRRRPWLPAALLPLALVLQGAFSLPYHPYYGTHYNVLLGGAKVAQHVVSLQDQGEGLDLAGRYLSALPRGGMSGAWIQSRSALVFKSKFIGLTTYVPDPRATYRVYYVHQIVRDLGGDEWAEAWERDRGNPPLWSVSFGGIPYVWIYGTAPVVPLAGRPQQEVNARLGERIHLLGFRLGEERLQPGQTLSLVLIWTSEGEVEEDYRVFCHLVSQDGQLVAQHDGRPVSEIRPVPTWRKGEVLEDLHTLALPSDLPPGTYELSAGMYDLETMARPPTFDAGGARLPEDRVVLGTIQVEVP